MLFVFLLLTEYLYKRCQVSSWEVPTKEINERIANKVGNAKRPKKEKTKLRKKQSVNIFILYVLAGTTVF